MFFERLLAEKKKSGYMELFANIPKATNDLRCQNQDCDTDMIVIDITPQFYCSLQEGG